MNEISGQIPAGNIDEDTTLRGQITGSATVTAGARLILRGQVTGDLVVEPNGSAEVYGMVCGDLVNRGNVSIYGAVIGALRDEVGTAVVDAGAKIGG